MHGSAAGETQLCLFGRTAYQCLSQASLWSVGKMTMLVWQNCLSVFVASIALKCGKDNYACLAKLLISVCRKHRSEVWERRPCLLGRIAYQCLSQASLWSVGKTTVLAWQNCLSVLVASINLKCGKDDYTCLAELLTSVARKHHSEVWERRLCLLGRAAYLCLLKYKMRCSWLDGISPSTYKLLILSILRSIAAAMRYKSIH